MSETVVIYHGNCPDGMTAAWAAWKELGDTATYHPALYGDSLPPISPGSKVYVLDFSYPRAVLVDLAQRADVTVLDHHKTAQADLVGLPFARFDMAHSGAYLAWAHFAPPLDTTPPMIVQYAEDRDLWRFALPASRAISQWLRCVPYELSAWDAAARSLETAFSACAIDGAAMLRFQDAQVRVMCDQAVARDIAGHEVHVVNASVFFSEVGDELCRRYPAEPFGAYYFDRGDGKRQWGARSRHGFDVSAVARTFGGGGHPAAAGWVEPTP